MREAGDVMHLVEKGQSQDLTDARDRADLNVHAEHFVRTIKESCLERMILFGEGSLRKAVRIRCALSSRA